MVYSTPVSLRRNCGRIVSSVGRRPSGVRQFLQLRKKIALNKACRIGNLDSVSKKRVGPGTARGLKVYEVLKYVLLEQDNRLEHHSKLTSKWLKVDKMRHILRKLSIGHYSFAFEGFEYRAQISRGRLGVEVICKLTV